MTGQPTPNGLQRKLGLFSVTSIVIANMIGAGIFTTTGLLLKDLGHPGIMISLWIIGGLVALAGALCYGALGAAMPQAGGEYLFLSRLYHPSAGFMSGWVSFFAGFSAPIAASAIGFAEYLGQAFPALLNPGLLDPSIEAAVFKRLWAAAVVILFTYIHMRGMEFGARIQNLLTALKIGVLFLLIVAGFSFGQGQLVNLAGGKPIAFDLPGLQTMGLSLMWIMFAYSGWNAAAYIGSEVRDPARNLPRSLILGTGIVMAIYLAVNLLYVYAAPASELSGVVAVGGMAAGRLFGTGWEKTVSILVAFALFSSLSAFIILGPRVYYAMAKDGLFFRFAGRINPRTGVPSFSILLQGLIALVMVMAGTFEQILTYMGFSLGVFPLLAVAGVFILRRRSGSAFRLPGFPLVPLFYLLISAAVLVLSLLERPLESGIAILTVLAGIPLYLVFQRRQRLAAEDNSTACIPPAAEGSGPPVSPVVNTLPG